MRVGPSVVVNLAYTLELEIQHPSNQLCENEFQLIFLAYLSLLLYIQWSPQGPQVQE